MRWNFPGTKQNSAARCLLRRLRGADVFSSHFRCWRPWELLTWPTQRGFRVWSPMTPSQHVHTLPALQKHLPSPPIYHGIFGRRGAKQTDFGRWRHSWLCGAFCLLTWMTESQQTLLKYYPEILEIVTFTSKRCLDEQNNNPHPLAVRTINSWFSEFGTAFSPGGLWTWKQALCKKPEIYARKPKTNCKTTCHNPLRNISP